MNYIIDSCHILGEHKALIFKLDNMNAKSKIYIINNIYNEIVNQMPSMLANHVH